MLRLIKDFNCLSLSETTITHLTPRSLEEKIATLKWMYETRLKNIVKAQWILYSLKIHISNHGGSKEKDTKLVWIKLN